MSVGEFVYSIANRNHFIMRLIRDCIRTCAQWAYGIVAMQTNVSLTLEWNESMMNLLSELLEKYSYFIP